MQERFVEAPAWDKPIAGLFRENSPRIRPGCSRLETSRRGRGTKGKQRIKSRPAADSRRQVTAALAWFFRTERYDVGAGHHR